MPKHLTGDDYMLLKIDTQRWTGQIFCQEISLDYEEDYYYLILVIDSFS